MAFRIPTPAFFIKAKATGSIIAPTVCSPINEDKIADIARNPVAIRQDLLPVKLITKRANRLSSP